MISPPPASPRRAYRIVTVESGDGGFLVALDGRPAKTPAGAALRVPTLALGEMLAAEWRAQGDKIDMAAMPAVRMAFTALDRTAAVAADMARELARHADADVLCYVADSPAWLLEAEVRRWTPLLDWARSELGVKLAQASGATHHPQSPEALAQMHALAAALEPFALTGLVFCAGLFGSAVLAFAVQRGHLNGEEAFELSRLDEALQAERWGEDAEASARTARLRAEADLAGRWLAALRG